MSHAHKMSARCSLLLRRNGFRCYSNVYSGVTTYNTRPERTKYDAIVIGAGHNGLVAASYLAKAGKKVAVFERRHLVGGAAVSEEIVPGFIFSRASYVLSLLRPVIVKDLELNKHGLKVYFRDPNSYTPIRGTSDYLMLGSNMEKNSKEIAKFSVADAENYSNYESWLERLACSIDPLIDSVPVNLSHIYSPSRKERWSTIKPIIAFGNTLSKLRQDLPSFYDLVMSPASKQVLESWFEGELLKATLATDAVIGAMISPYQAGSGYVLLHHVMGEIQGRKNAWVYPEGGMGAVSASIARAALSYGVDIYTEQSIEQILVDNNCVKGVAMEDGTVIDANIVLSNATPSVTFLDLLPNGSLSKEFQAMVSSVDYTSPVTKFNVALSGLPNFIATPNPSNNDPGPNHYCTIHLNSETMDQIHQSYLDAQQGIWSRRPIIEMSIPSSLDPTLAPEGCHVASLFTQYTPYDLKYSQEGWTNEMKREYTNLVFNCIEEYAPGFRDLIVDYEILTPPDLENVFGLTGGNIFHGALSLDQLYVARPTPSNSSFATPEIKGLFLCGSGAHPGGGVMGAPGRLAALSALALK